MVDITETDCTARANNIKQTALERLKKSQFKGNIDSSAWKQIRIVTFEYHIYIINTKHQICS